MEFLVEFDIEAPAGTSERERHERQEAEAVAAAALVEQGHLSRVWTLTAPVARHKVLGLYSAENRAQLDQMLEALPLHDWMHLTVTTLAPHANDPGSRRSAPNMTGAGRSGQLPEPRLTLVFRLEATLGQPIDLGDTHHGRRRIVPLTGGTFAGPELNGTLIAGTSGDWQTILPDGTALGDIRYVLQTDRGDVLDVRSRGVRHGSAQVLARLSRGEDVEASEYTFRTSTRIETAAPDLDWLNKGIFVGVGGRTAGAVVYEIYLVG